MTVNTTNVQNTYIGTGIRTVFPYTFQILTDQNGLNPQISTVQVLVNDVLQNTGFITTANNDQEDFPGGNVTFTVPPINGATVQLLRSTPQTQNLSFPLETEISTPALENALDKNVLIMQENTYALSQKPNFPLEVDGGIFAYAVGGNVTTINPNTPGYALLDNGPGLLPSFQPVASASGGNVIGAASSGMDNLAKFADGTGKTLADSGIPVSAIYSTSNPPPIFGAHNNIRAYLVSGSPYADGSSAGNGTIFAGPLSTGKKITIDDGNGNLSALNLTEISLALTLTVNSSYSLFLVNTAGILALEVDVWSGINTPLTYGSDAAGRLCKNGATNKLLIAEFYCSTTNKIFDYTGDRSLVNIYNQISKPFTAKIAASSWTYTTAVIRAINADTTNGSGRVRIFMGSVSGGIEAKYSQPVIMAGSASNPINCFGIGLDSITTFTGNIAVIAALGSSTVQFYATQTNLYSGTPSVGSHFLQMLEYCPAATAGATMIGTQTQGSNSLTGTLAA